MAGVDVLLVARMAGTSVATIERVYGHFRNQCYQEPQARLRDATIGGDNSGGSNDVRAQLLPIRNPTS